MTDSQNTNKCQERLDSSTAVKDYGTDDLFLSRKTTPAPKLLSWTTEDEETLSVLSCRHHRGDKALLLVLCLICAAALGLSLLMLFGVLRPHCPPDTKIGKNESPRCLHVQFLSFHLKTSNNNCKSPKFKKQSCACLPQNNHSRSDEQLKKDNQEIVMEFETLNQGKLCLPFERPQNTLLRSPNVG